MESESEIFEEIKGGDMCPIIMDTQLKYVFKWLVQNIFNKH